MIGISYDTSRGTSVTLKAYNLETGSRPQEPKISGLPKGSRIDEVAFSPQINVTYILIRENNRASIYRTDANNRLRKVFSSSSIGRIAALQSEDMLLYDNDKNGAVYALNNKGKRVLVSPTTGQYALLGTDKDNNIYIGQLSSSGLVSSILKGNINRSFETYRSLSYHYPLASIMINYNGQLKLI